MGNIPRATSSFVYFTTAAKILNEKIPEINITVRATGAGVQNVNLLIKGEVDMGATDTGIAHEAYQGKGVFEGKPYRISACYSSGMRLIRLISLLLKRVASRTSTALTESYLPRGH